MIIDSADATAQRAGIANFRGEAGAAYPKVHVTGDPFALHFVRLVADAEREHIGPRQHGVDLHFASIDTAGPASVRSIEVEPVTLAVDGDVVRHGMQLPASSRQLPTARLSFTLS